MDSGGFSVKERENPNPSFSLYPASGKSATWGEQRGKFGLVNQSSVFYKKRDMRHTSREEAAIRKTQTNSSKKVSGK